MKRLGLNPIIDLAVQLNEWEVEWEAMAETKAGRLYHLAEKLVENDLVQIVPPVGLRDGRTG